MPDDLHSLCVRVVVDFGHEIERLGSKRASCRLDGDLDALLAERWPLARQAAHDACNPSERRTAS